MLASKLLFTIATIALALPAQAGPAPIVFDFEDGLHGWELQGSAQRVQTQILGGEWAIFGDGIGLTLDGSQRVGSAALRTTFDLTLISSITVDVFFLGSFDGEVPNPIFLLGLGEDREGSPLSPAANPGTVTFDVSDVQGMVRFRLSWGVPQSCLPIGPCGPEIPADSLLAFIDNITFHPVPEPGTLSLLAVSLVTLGICRAHGEGSEPEHRGSNRRASSVCRHRVVS